MYIRIGILGRARQAIGIARLHALREALYIDVKYNSQLATRRSGEKTVNCNPASQDALASLAMRRPALACKYAAVRYRTELDAIPTADRSLRRAVAQAGGFPKTLIATCLTCSVSRALGRISLPLLHAFLCCTQQQNSENISRARSSFIVIRRQ
jgi:hypothetical protein